jgi:hypothetical protein
MNSGATDFIRTHTKEKNDMSIKKKMTDFVHLEQGSIGKKAAMVTGAAMVAGMLAAAVNVGEAKASCGPGQVHRNVHTNYYTYYGSAVGVIHANINSPDDCWCVSC